MTRNFEVSGDRLVLTPPDPSEGWRVTYERFWSERPCSPVGPFTLQQIGAGVSHREINPGTVFDLDLPLEEAAKGYEAMDKRRPIKTMLRP